MAVGRQAIDRSMLHRQMTKDDGRPVTQSQRGTIPGVLGTLTFAEIRAKAIKTLKLNFIKSPVSFRLSNSLMEGFPVY